MHGQRSIAGPDREYELPVLKHSVVVKRRMMVRPVERDDLPSGQKLDAFVRVEALGPHRALAVIDLA